MMKHVDEVPQAAGDQAILTQNAKRVLTRGQQKGDDLYKDKPFVVPEAQKTGD
jgi:hypothetical protein